MALVLIICRLCKLSSEFPLAEHFYRQSDLPHLLGIPTSEVYDQRRYRTLNELLPHRERLEVLLKQSLGE